MGGPNWYRGVVSGGNPIRSFRQFLARMCRFATIQNVTDDDDRQTDDMPWHRLDYGRPKTTLAADEILQCRCLAGESRQAGCSIQSRGPAAAKLRSPNRVLVRGTQRVSMSADGSRRRVRAGVRDELTVIDKIRCRCIMKCLVDQEGQLKVDSLSDRKPVELPQQSTLE